MHAYTFPAAGETLAGDEALFQDNEDTAPVWKECPAGKEITPDIVGIIRRPLQDPFTPVALALGEVIQIMTAGGNPAQDKTRLRTWAPKAIDALRRAAPFLGLPTTPETPRFITT